MAVEQGRTYRYGISWVRSVDDHNVATVEISLKLADINGGVIQHPDLLHH